MHTVTSAQALQQKKVGRRRMATLVSAKTAVGLYYAKMTVKCSNYAQIMLEIEDYAFSFVLCFSRQIMLKIMLAYCINA